MTNTAVKNHDRRKQSVSCSWKPRRALSREETSTREISLKGQQHTCEKKERTKGLGGFMIVAHASLMDIPLDFARVNRFAFSGWCAKIYKEREKVSSSSALAKPRVLLNTRRRRRRRIRDSRVNKTRGKLPTRTKIVSRNESIVTQTFPSAPFGESKSME